MNSPISPTAACARAFLDAAAEVNAAESQIKAALLSAAEARDIDRIVQIVGRWNTLPACEVLHGLGLDPCGDLEVQDKRRPDHGA